MSISRGQFIGGAHVASGNRYFRKSWESRYHTRDTTTVSGNAHTNFDPRINRHTGRPHEHAGEIARRARQAERRAANEVARG